MKPVIRSFVCGYRGDAGNEGRCTAGDKNCNNYCNHDHSKPMARCPKTYETIIWEERDIWADVIHDIASWNEPDLDIREFLVTKYEIKFKSILNE